MKKTIKKVIITAIILVVGLMVTAAYRIEAGRMLYTLRLPEIEKLEYIALRQGAAQVSIQDTTEMEELRAILLGEGRQTKDESIQDMPVNTSEMTEINFYFKEQGASTIFTYKRGNRYYIEQPYNGCYPISQEEYQQIISQITETSGDAEPLTLLADSVSYADSKVSFTIPESSNIWSIWIGGRVEVEDFGGMSVHYLEQKSEENSWESGKTYSFDVSGGGYTELQLEAKTEGDEIVVDIVKLLPEELKAK